MSAEVIAWLDAVQNGRTATPREQAVANRIATLGRELEEAELHGAKRDGQRKRLMADNARFRKALKFYANPASYSPGSLFSVAEDNGTIARNALAPTQSEETKGG